MGRLRSAVVAAGALALIGGLAAARPVHATDHAASVPVPPPLPSGRTWTVTLVTGDIVGVRTIPGRPPQVTVRPGPGRQRVIFSKYADTSDRIEVLPHDVAPLVGTVLDPTLFDITALIRNGDDDAHRSSVPLIVQGGGGASGAAAATVLSGSARVTRTLEVGFSVEEIIFDAQTYQDIGGVLVQPTPGGGSVTLSTTQVWQAYYDANGHRL
jgi:hypothetical protein